jgi:hypothetical protein
MKRNFLARWGAILVATYVLFTVQTAQAVIWHGMNLSNNANQATLISNVIDGSNHLLTTMTGKTGQFAVAGLFANAAGNPTILAPNVGINATGTPYLQLKFIDQRLADGTWPGYEIFFTDTVGPVDQSRGSLGASFAQDAVGAGWRATDTTTVLTNFGNGPPNNAGPFNPIPNGDPLNGFYGELKYSSGGTKRSPSYATDPYGTELALPANAALVDAGITNRIQRTDGAIVTATIGQLSDGTIEYTIKSDAGVFSQWTSPYLKNHNGLNIPDWTDVSIRFVGGGGPTGSLTSTATFLDFQYGGDYNAFRLTLGPAPEPGSFALLGLGSLILMAKRRRK